MKKSLLLPAPPIAELTSHQMKIAKLKDLRIPPCQILFVILFCCLAGGMGCNNQAPETNSTDPSETGRSDKKPITIVVLASSREVTGEWPETLQKEFEFLDLGKVEFKFQPAEEFFKNPSEGDIVLYPPHLFGDLLHENLLRRIPDYVVDSEGFAENDILKRQRKTFGFHDGDRYGLSLGVSSYFLLARRDILEANQLKVPTTWKQYQEVCDELVALKSKGELKGAAGKENWSPGIEPTAAGWLSTTLLARSAAYARSKGRYSVLFDYSSWKPLIDSPPFLRAAEEFSSAWKQMNDAHRGLNPRQVEQAFLKGESVFAITWPHPPEVREEEQIPDLIASLYPLPGTTTKYDYSEKAWVTASKDEQQVPLMGVGGWCGSVLKKSKNSGAATRRLGLLASKEFSTKHLPANLLATPFRLSHLKQIPDWLSPVYRDEFQQQYSELLDQQDRADLWMIRPRIQSATRYEKSLSSGLKAIIEGADAKSALSKVQSEWEKINEDVDTKFQELLSLEGLGIR